MSGVQGPLETRTKTTVDTVQTLSGLDATPFDSGELAFVRVSGETYRLSREDTQAADGFNVLAVGPQGSAGRWLRVAGLGPSGGLPFVAYTELLVGANAPGGVIPTLLISTTITTTTPGSSLLIEADLSAQISAGGNTLGAIFIDGIGHVPSNMSLQNTGGQTAVESSSLTLKVPVSPGAHTVSLLWVAIAGTAAIVLPGGGHAMLAVSEVL